MPAPPLFCALRRRGRASGQCTSAPGGHSMSLMSVEPLEPQEGWGVLHLFCRLTPASEAEAVSAAVKSAQEASSQVVSFAVLGHKADLGFMLLNYMVGYVRHPTRIWRTLRNIFSEHAAATVFEHRVKDLLHRSSGRRMPDAVVE